MTDNDPADDTPRTRFLTLDDVATELATSRAQVYALVRRQDLRSIKIGGRGQYRVSRDDLEDYITDLYKQTKTYLDTHPYTDEDDDTHG
ncbi:helix-turn-helix transcriptional regulator [Nocardioides sp.]|uniref:helix-turn-helix transcriptional regulator n=1 Tax=Nocardioides sp. TaxID=35761 RepID=UPI003568A9D3